MRTFHQPEDRYCYTLSHAHPPIATVQPGERFKVRTIDAFHDALESDDDLPAAHTPGYPYVNPLTGPFEVEGAHKGDALAVTIHAIEPTRDYAVTALVKDFGALTRTATTALLHPPLPERTRVLPLKAGRVWFGEKLACPYAPFVGTLGVAPELEAVSSLTPGNWGGNMDCVETGPGATLILPVFVEGGRCFIGDAHACQGDGEPSGVAAEMPAEITLSIEVRKGEAPPVPRIETTKCLMSIGSARPLEDAARIAWHDLAVWLAADLGLDLLEVYMFLGLCGQMRVGNVVDPNYTMVAKIDKALLPGGDA
ncbi:MAG: acetamidase/formamidase family protein [Opitutales bacterium]